MNVLPAHLNRFIDNSPSPWLRQLYIVAPERPHWSLLLHGILLKAMWDPSQGCISTEANNAILSATLVPCLTGFKLFYLSAGCSHIVTLIIREA
jgi:hypothetical protein